MGTCFYFPLNHYVLVSTSLLVTTTGNNQVASSKWRWGRGRTKHYGWMVGGAWVYGVQQWLEMATDKIRADTNF
jgi:hypothetical protein